MHYLMIINQVVLIKSILERLAEGAGGFNPEPQKKVLILLKYMLPKRLRSKPGPTPAIGYAIFSICLLLI